MTHRTLSLTILPVLCSLFLLTGCASDVARSYQSGEELLAQEKYAEAAARFQDLRSYEDASRLRMYSRAALTAENGDYETAVKAFEALGEFRDAPQMLRYYNGRELESGGRSSLSVQDPVSATTQLMNASAVYQSLSDFRDSAQRSSACLNTLYECGRSFLENNRYSEARDIFAALGSINDSASLMAYCEAALLEADGNYPEAIDAFSSISAVLDAGARADADREILYRQAQELSSQGNPEGAIDLYTILGSYKDSETLQSSMVRQIIRERLQAGDYDGALFQLDAVADTVSLERLSGSEQARYSSFLDGFAEAYLHFSAGSMDSYSGYFGVAPYIESAGALEWRFRQVLMIGDYSHNSNFNYYGSELLDLFRLDGNYYLAYIRARASVLQPVGLVEVDRTFRVVLNDSPNGLYAGSIGDCLYGNTNPTGRPVVSGPLPNGELPPDEDGDGIIMVDVWKKGFRGTMIIVLDPSRVFVGGPESYGGNGVLLEDIVRRYDALGGINAGGFIDEDGGGSGGLPEGLTIYDGKSYLWASSGVSAAFDEDNILHVGYYTQEEAAEMGIRDCASFGPALIVNGIGEYNPGMESGINPRTAIGQREDGAVLMLCIDGRQLRSIGANFADIRDVMFDFGAINAMSLDGGSSTVMYYNGEYQNSPSSASGTSRYLPNAFLIRK
mgnify:CR=1 FL=1